MKEAFLTNPLKVSARIDFYLVPKSITNWVVKANTKVSNAPDHKAVVLDLRILSEKRGPGLWKFYNSLVEDNEFVSSLKEREKYLDLKDDRLKWELIKMEIRSITISYTKYKGKQCRNRVTELQNRLEA